VADPNRALFESVVRLLAPVLDELVFVGGCTTGLFITDPAAGGIRPTKRCRRDHRRDVLREVRLSLVTAAHAGPRRGHHARRATLPVAA